MAQQVIKSLICDMTQACEDGKEVDAVATIEFGLDGFTYEIDLSEGWVREFRDGLSKYVDAARLRPISPGVKTAASVRRRGDKAAATTTRRLKLDMIRPWAETVPEFRGKVPPKGRCPLHIEAAFDKMFGPNGETYVPADTDPRVPAFSAAT